MPVIARQGLYHLARLRPLPHDPGHPALERETEESGRGLAGAGRGWPRLALGRHRPPPGLTAGPRPSGRSGKLTLSRLQLQFELQFT